MYFPYLPLYSDGFLSLAAFWSFAPPAPLPPDGFVHVRQEGRLCGDFCTAGVLREDAGLGDLSGSDARFLWIICGGPSHGGIQGGMSKLHGFTVLCILQLHCKMNN